jgi:hypothetical protein
LNPAKNSEQLEWLALKALPNGQGLHPVSHISGVDHLYLSWSISQPERPIVFFRSNSRTVAIVEFRVGVVPHSERSNYAKFLDQIASADVPPDHELTQGKVGSGGPGDGSRRKGKRNKKRRKGR